MYETWANARNTEFKDFAPEKAEFPSTPNSIQLLSTPEMNYCTIAVEVRKKDGQKYRNEVLYSIFCGINRVIREFNPTLTLFHLPDFKDL